MSDPLTLGMVGGTVIGGLGNLWNAFTGERSYQYQKDLNNLQMSREDTAWQRAVADAEKAGISKAALTGGANSQALSAGAAPTLKTDFQQRLMNTLSASQMQTQNETLQNQLELLKQQVEDYGKTRDSKIAAEKAEYAWRLEHPGISVAGYPSAANYLTSWFSEHPNFLDNVISNANTNRLNGYVEDAKELGRNISDKTSETVQEVKIATENAIKVVTEAAEKASGKVKEELNETKKVLSNSISDAYSPETLFMQMRGF